MYHTIVRVNQSCITCNRTILKGEEVLANNILIVKRPPKKSIKRQYQCAECQDGDNGFITCGKCNKVIYRKDAFLSLNHIYLCETCQDD